VSRTINKATHPSNIIRSRFRPSLGLRNRHLQTLARTFLPKPEINLRERKFITLSDGDELQLDFYGAENNRVCLLLHGLEGSANSPYIRKLVHLLTGHGKTVVVVHFRGCGQRDNLKARSYHSGVSDDLGEAIDYLESIHKSVEVAAGFSLGGNVLLKYLGERADKSSISKAMAVSVPLRLDICADAIDSGFSKLYQWHLLRSLKRKTRRKLKQFPGCLKLSKKELLNIKNFWQFDDRVTAPLNGFAGAKDYYQKVSSRQFLKHITTPTLILQAKDDPFMTPEVLPKASELSPDVVLEVSEHGGHVGFVGDEKLGDYLSWRLLEWMQ